MYQRQGKTAFKKDLTNIVALLKELGDPEKKIKTIHVAGTNGKGSTSHMIASVLQEQGYKVGLYTSPHLKDFTERIRINGKPIRKNCVINFVKKNKTFLEKQKLSFFEMTVGMGFNHFAKNKVDFAVIETGLGGRLDSTNVIHPLVSVITNIGLDHTQFLGNTLSEIAKEKAGIIKENTPVIIGEKQQETTPVFTEIAKSKNAPIYFASELVKKCFNTDLKGVYQKKNIKTAIQTLLVLKKTHKVNISDTSIKGGLEKVVQNTDLKGRWQVLEKEPKIICDTAHNKEGLKYVLEQLLSEKYNDLHIVLGVVNDKDLDAVLPLFPKKARYYFCKPDIPRGLESDKLKKKANEFGLLGDKYKSVNEALKVAKTNANKNDLIFVGGSTFVVAEVV
jgi:dihydrofolate synthase/folylpolyglutamate synthase